MDPIHQSGSPDPDLYQMTRIRNTVSRVIRIRIRRYKQCCHVFKGSIANDLMLSYLLLLPKLNFGQLPEKEKLSDRSSIYWLQSW
jgi:hypothetical protein